MFSKAELIEKGRHYFDKKEVKVMYATPDGNFFYQASKSYADSHAKSNKIEVIEITRADLTGKPEKKDDSELHSLRKEAKELKIKGFMLMKMETLKSKIADATK